MIWIPDCYFDGCAAQITITNLIHESMHEGHGQTSIIQSSYGDNEKRKLHKLELQ